MAISVAGVYRPVNGQLTDIEGAGGTSPLDAPPEQRAQEAALRRCLVQDDHRARRSADALALLLGAAMLAAASDAIDTPLTAQPGDPARGRRIVENRSAQRLPAVPLRPVSRAAPAGQYRARRWMVSASRLTAGQIRLRLVDAGS